MTSLHRIGVFVQRRAVELAEAVGIVGEVTGHPVEQHGKPGPVTGIDEMREVGGRAEPAGRRKQAGRLIAP